MSSFTTTSLLLPAYTGHFVADVIGADATATTFVLDCDFKKDKEDCGITKDTIIVGPWADKTLSPGAATTGLYKESMSFPDEDFTFSVICEMSKTYAKTCTSVNLGGNDEGSPTATFTHTASDTSLFKYFGYGSFTWVPVTVTAGHEFLSATQVTSRMATSTNDASETAQAGEATTEESSTSSDFGDQVTLTGEATPTQTSESGAATTRALNLLTLMGVAAAVISF